MQRRQRRRRLGEIRPQAGPAGFQLDELFLQAGRPHALRDRVDEIGQLPFHGGQLAAVAIDPGGCLARQPVPLGGELPDEQLDMLRLHQLTGERFKDPGFQWAPSHPCRVAAGPVPGIQASQVVLAKDGKGPFAAAAEDLARKQMARPALLPISVR